MADEFSHLRDDSENRTFVHDSVAKARPDGTVRDKPTGMLGASPIAGGLSADSFSGLKPVEYIVRQRILS
jgi:hypothetical protein